MKIKCKCGQGILFLILFSIILTINSDAISNECWSLVSKSPELDFIGDKGCTLFLNVYDIYGNGEGKADGGIGAPPYPGGSIVSITSNAVDFEIPSIPSSYPEAKLIIESIDFRGSQADTSSPYQYKLLIEPSSGTQSTINSPPFIRSSEPGACYTFKITDNLPYKEHYDNLHWATNPGQYGQYFGCPISLGRFSNDISISPNTPFSVSFKLSPDTIDFLNQFKDLSPEELIDIYRCKDNTGIDCSYQEWYAPNLDGYFNTGSMFIRYDPEDASAETAQENVAANRGASKISVSADIPGSSAIEVIVHTNQGSKTFLFTNSIKSYDIPDWGPTNEDDYIGKRIKWVSYTIRFITSSSDETPKLNGKPSLDFIPPNNNLFIEKVGIVQSIEGANYPPPSFRYSIVKDKENMVFVKVGATKKPVGVTVKVNFGKYSDSKSKVIESSYSSEKKWLCEDAFVFYFPAINSEGIYDLKVVVDENDNIPETNEEDNKHEFQFEVRDTHKLDITYFPIYVFGWNPTPDMGPNLDKQEDFVKATYPIATNDLVSYTTPGIPVVFKPLSMRAILLLDVAFRCTLTHLNNLNKKIHRCVGVVPEGYYLPPPSDIDPNLGATGLSLGITTLIMPSDDGVLAHEIGHTYGLGDDYTKDIDYVDVDGMIYDTFGEIGGGCRNLDYPPQIYSFMGKSEESTGVTYRSLWVTPKNYATLFDSFVRNEKDPKMMVIRGGLTTDNKIHIQPWYDIGNVILDEGDDWQHPDKSSYLSSSADGKVIDVYANFDLSGYDLTISDYPFLYLIPSDNLETVKLHINDAYLEVKKTNNPPIINSITVNKVKVDDKDKLAIRWEAEDKDNPLSYMVYYSNDSGKNWNLLGYDIKDKNLLVDKSQISCDNECIVKVIASDNFNQAQLDYNFFINCPDIIKDKSVNILDLNFLKSNYGKPITGATINADINKDNKINILDLNILKSDYGKPNINCID